MELSRKEHKKARQGLTDEEVETVEEGKEQAMEINLSGEANKEGQKNISVVDRC